MGTFSIWHWMIVLVVGLLLFGGRDKVSNLMGDFAKGIKSFKKNMAEDDDASMEASITKPTGSIAAPNLRQPNSANTTAAAAPQTTAANHS